MQTLAFRGKPFTNFSSLAWINGGSEGVREYKKQKKEKY